MTTPDRTDYALMAIHESIYTPCRDAVTEPLIIGWLDVTAQELEHRLWIDLLSKVED